MIQLMECRRSTTALRDLDIVGILGGDSSIYHSERSRAARAIVAELYPPPLVSDMFVGCPSLDYQRDLF